jgi:hypothetical protein
MKSKARIVVCLLVFLAFLSTQSFGTAVTSGYLQVFSFWSGGQPAEFYATAGGFRLYIPVNGGNWAANCYFCAPWTIVDISGYAAGTDLGPGFANGVYVEWGNPNAPYQSVISFTGPSIWLNHGAGSYTAPISFSGALCGFDPGTGTCVVDLPDLSGQGTVFAFAEDRGNGLLFVDTFDYGFQTPEPGTLALFGSGVVGLAGLIWRKLEP